MCQSKDRRRLTRIPAAALAEQTFGIDARQFRIAFVTVSRGGSGTVEP